MRFEPVDPPRVFRVGPRGVPIRDCGRMRLQPDEQVTFLTESGAEYDLARKSWGFYATPSLNSRLKGFGLRAALIRGGDGKYFVFLVEAGREPDMEAYLESEGLRLVWWLDDDAALAELERRLGRP